MHRQPNEQLPVAGDGPYIIAEDGKRYIDASGGAAVSGLGHSNTKVLQAIKDQVDKIALLQYKILWSPPVIFTLGILNI